MSLKPFICLCTIFVLVVINPLVIQGCRCPEPLPYDYQSESVNIARSLNQHLVVESEEGVLEMTLSHSYIEPILIGGRFDWIGSAHATQPCPIDQPPPARYRVFTTLNATWQPAGDPNRYTLGQNIQLVGTTDYAYGFLPAKLDLSGYGSDRRAWSASLDLSQEQRYELVSSQLRGTLQNQPWLIEASQESIQTFRAE